MGVIQGVSKFTDPDIDSECGHQVSKNPDMASMGRGEPSPPGSLIGFSTDEVSKRGSMRKIGVLLQIEFCKPRLVLKQYGELIKDALTSSWGTKLHLHLSPVNL